jgi:hypothetical protein
MKNMEIGLSMNSRYKYISDIVDSDFPSLSERIIWLPKNVIELIIQIIWMTAIYAYFDIRLLLLVIISSIIWYFIERFSRKVSKKYEIEWKFSLWRQIWKYSNLFLHKFSELAISGWLSSTIKSYANLLNEENKNSIKKDFSRLIWSIQDLINYNLRDILLKLIVWYWVFSWTSSVGMVVLVVSSMWTLWQIIFQIFSFRNDYNDFVFQQESILLMLKMSKPVWNVEYSEKVNNIEFKNIVFSYPNLSKYEQEYFEIVQKNIIWKDLWSNWLDERIKGLIENIKEESTSSFN